MHLEGSCHCKNVEFTCESKTPYPFNRCYCSICRKLNGGGGYAIYIMAETKTMKITGEEFIRVYRSVKNDRDIYEEDGLGFSRRSFCVNCGSMLWNHNIKHEHWIYLFASAVDTPLPAPPEIRHIMLDHAVSWIKRPDDATFFPQYPDESIEDWHRRHNLFDCDEGS